MIDLLITLAVGTFAGVLSGMFGIGGGLVIVPSLIIIFSMPLQTASGTSLATMLLPVGLFASIKFYKAGFLSIKAAALISFGVLIGVFFGAKLATSIPNEMLKQAFGFFLLYVSWVFIAPLELFKLKKPQIYKEKNLQSTSNILILLGLGIIAGLLSGMFGIGGGLITTPFLMSVLKYDPKKAIGTSLASMLLPVRLPGVLVYHQSGNVIYIFVVCLAIGLIIGSILGARITLNLPSHKVKRAYGILVLFVALDFIFKGLIASKI